MRARSRRDTAAQAKQPTQRFFSRSRRPVRLQHPRTASPARFPTPAPSPNPPTAHRRRPARRQTIAAMGLLEDRITEVTHNNQALGRPTLTREDYDEMCRNSRLSMPSFIRIPGAAVAGFSVGMSLGLSMGSKMAGLRFRAEHAHKLPTTTAGWYLYHKSKNYHLAFGGLKEGLRTGTRLSVLTAAMFCAENLFDVYRGSKDMFNTVGASLAVAGGFSLINKFSVPETARTARKGLLFGLAYGGVQDLLSLIQGRPVGYVEFIRRQVGMGGNKTEEESMA